MSANALASTARCFIDTSILIYSQAADAAQKRDTALSLLRELHLSARGVISTRVLQEYANAAIRKLHLPVDRVREHSRFFEQFEVIQVTVAIVHAGLNLHQRKKLSFYDAVIVSQHKSAGAVCCFRRTCKAAESSTT